MKNKRILLCGLFALAIMLAVPSCSRDTDDTDAGDYVSGEENGPEYTPEPTVDEPSNNEDPEENGFDFSEGLDENGFFLGIRALDYVELFNYQALSIPADVHQVTEADIQDVIDGIMADHVTLEPIMDRPVANGDTVNIDFVGSVDDVEFEGGSTAGMGMYVTIGETQFIDDFLDQLIGHTPGTVVDVEVTFPDEYHEPSLQGLDALFVTTINHIGGEEVTPELTDEFVYANFFHSGWSTVEELMEEIQTFLQNNAIQQFVHEYLTTQVVISNVPEQLIRYHEQALVQSYVGEAAQFGMDLETMLGFFGFESVEDLIESSQEDIERDARLSLVLQAVAEDAGFNVSQEEVSDFFEEHFGMSDISEFEETYGLPWLKQFVRNQTTREYIGEHAVFE